KPKPDARTTYRSPREGRRPGFPVNLTTGPVSVVCPRDRVPAAPGAGRRALPSEAYTLHDGPKGGKTGRPAGAETTAPTGLRVRARCRSAQRERVSLRVKSVNDAPVYGGRNVTAAPRLARHPPPP